MAFNAPAFQDDVLDEAGILSNAERDALIGQIRNLRAADDIWAAVYIAKSLQQASIEEAAVDTFSKWKLGQKGKDNGLLVLIVPAEHKMRIEVGYGLEGVITDALSRRIIDEVFAPAFRANHFVDGLTLGFEAMAKAKRGENALPEKPPVSAQQVVNWDGAGTRFLLGLGINLLPIGLYSVALPFGRLRNVRKPIEPTSTPFWIYFFFGLFFAIFYVVAGAAFPENPAILYGLIGANVVFAGAFGIEYLRRAARMLFPMGSSGTSAFDASPMDRSRRESSSSDSWSSGSDSDSSSSGGGRSGGGGASGSW
ncbi:MAG: TPM domain-containing protein [Thiobacillus sp.]|nr:TPM domain-containing protein [Thiobacillus sp.]